jgi:maleate cis-trans isomerase
MSGKRIRIAILFPSTGLVDGELCDMAEERNADALIFKVAPRQVAAADDADAVAAMTIEMGAPELLAAVARQAIDTSPDVLVWACTSGSFLGEGTATRTQAQAMSAAAGGVPATTTSLAILDALNTHGVRHVAAITPYHADIGRKFVAFLEQNGFVVDGEAHAGCGSDAEVGALDLAALVPLVGQAVAATTQAIVIPCTALRRQSLERDLRQAFGIPVILANAATLDHAVKLAQKAVPGGC